MKQYEQPISLQFCKEWLKISNASTISCLKFYRKRGRERNKKNNGGTLNQWWLRILFFKAYLVDSLPVTRLMWNGRFGASANDIEIRWVTNTWPLPSSFRWQLQNQKHLHGGLKTWSSFHFWPFFGWSIMLLLRIGELDGISGVEFSK